ncbi:MAG: curli assembly protein CsgF [Rickettsiales bacterium]
MSRFIYVFTVAFFLLIGAALRADASPVRFRFTNPAFGGSPLNASFFLNSAEAQKQFKEKEETQSLKKRLEDQVESRLIAAVSSQIAEAITDSPGEQVIVLNDGGIVIRIGADGSIDIDVIQMPSVGDINVSE